MSSIRESLVAIATGVVLGEERSALGQDIASRVLTETVHRARLARSSFDLVASPNVRHHAFRFGHFLHFLENASASAGREDSIRSASDMQHYQTSIRRLTFAVP